MILARSFDMVSQEGGAVHDNLVRGQLERAKWMTNPDHHLLASPS
jgi:hypothetical protein